MLASEELGRRERAEADVLLARAAGRGGDLRLLDGRAGDLDCDGRAAQPAVHGRLGGEVALARQDAFAVVLEGELDAAVLELAGVDADVGRDGGLAQREGAESDDAEQQGGEDGSSHRSVLRSANWRGLREGQSSWSKSQRSTSR